MTFPLATYTAENGLAWFYDKSAIDFAELDKCRRRNMIAYLKTKRVSVS